MSKITLTPVINFTTPSAVTSTNDNYDKITAAFENTLSRDGTTPNQMNADIDMNGHDVMNVGSIDATNFIFEGLDFGDLIDQAEAAAVASQASATASAASASTASTQATNAANSAISAAASAASAAATVQPTLAAGANKPSPTDTDRITILDNAASLGIKYITIPNLVSSIFTTARTITNAVFATASLKLINAGGFSTLFANTALTADRTITVPNADVNLTRVNNIIGYDQTWQDLAGSRVAGTSYQNLTGRAIFISLSVTPSGTGRTLQVSTNGSTWIDIASFTNAAVGIASTLIPDTYFYRISSTGTVNSWGELR